jgi:hypothetical protein
MYWPIGAPRIYAASDHRTPKDRVLEPGDSADIQPFENYDNENPVDTPGGAGGSQFDIGNERGMSQIEPEQVDQKDSRPEQSLENGFNRRGPHASRSNVSGSIIGLTVSRNGLMFATITTTTLTIWQTRVRCNNNLYRESD